MQNIYTKYRNLLILTIGLLLGFNAEAQTTYFEQNFDGPGPFVSATPNNTQFNSLAANNNASFSTSGGALTMTRGTAPAQVSFVRNTNFSPVPSTLYLEVDINVPIVTAPINGAAIFNIGRSLTGVGAPANTDVFARFSINLGVNNTYQIRNTPGLASGVTANSVIYANTQTVKVIVAMNNGSENTTYFDPRDAAAPQIVLAPGTYDIWVNNLPLVLGRGKVAGTSGNPTLTNFNFLFNTGEGTIVMDNLKIRDISGVLPVKLTDFNAQTIDNKVELGWETAWERNSKEFIVQRSSDLKEFGDIGRVTAAGETDGRRQYSFTDNTPLLGASYYRLRMVDQDGSYEYSKVKDVIVRPGDPLVLVSPNPATSGVVRVRAFGVDVSSLRLTSLLGQSISYRIQRAGPDTWELLPELPLATGLYLIHSGSPPAFRAIRFLVK
jgi:hypothetical protein